MTTRRRWRDDGWRTGWRIESNFTWWNRGLTEIMIMIDPGLEKGTWHLSRANDHDVTFARRVLAIEILTAGSTVLVRFIQQLQLWVVLESETELELHSTKAEILSHHSSKHLKYPVRDISRLLLIFLTFPIFHPTFLARFMVPSAALLIWIEYSIYDFEKKHLLTWIHREYMNRPRYRNQPRGWGSFDLRTPIAHCEDKSVF